MIIGARTSCEPWPAACRLPPSDAVLAEDAHQLCAFGQWLYTPSNAFLRRMPVFVHIEALHKAMHDSTRRTCKRLRAQGILATADYDALMSDVARFKHSLIEFQEKASFTLRCVDPLTGALNPARLLPDLREAMERLAAHGRRCGVVLLAIGVNDVNQALGHETGDRIYRRVGAEFVVYLPGRDADECEAAKDRLLRAIGTAATEVIGSALAVLPLGFAVAVLAADADPEVALDDLQTREHSVHLADAAAPKAAAGNAVATETTPESAPASAAAQGLDDDQLAVRA